MTTVDVKDAAGEVAGTAELSADVYEIEPNVHVMHRAVMAQRACWRQGTANTRTRSDRRGGGRKPWRQKGTGRARQGSIRSPQWKGGGVVFGPHTRAYDQKVNNKEVKLALRSALSAKLADGELLVVKDFDFDEPRTKLAVAAMKALDLEGRKTTIVVDVDDVNSHLAFRNLPDVTIVPVDIINAFDLINNKRLVIAESCLERIEEVLA